MTSGVTSSTATGAPSASAAAPTAAAASAATAVATSPPAPTAKDQVPAVDVGSNGRVNIEAAPEWCNVSVDGRHVGPTPIVNYELAAGSHVIRCDTAGGLSRSFPVQIYKGQTTQHTFATSP